MTLNNPFAKVQVTGYNQVTILYCCKAKILKPCLKVFNEYKKSVSEFGLFHDLRMVGAKPSISVIETRITDNTGCLAINHRNSAINERIKNKVSNLVISFLPFRIPSINTEKQAITTANVTQEPTPAPA